MTKNKWPMVKLGDVCDINPRIRKKPSSKELVSFVPMDHVSPEGFLLKSESRVFEEVSKGYTLFEKNSVLVAKITPCFENKKTAVAKIESNVGAGSTEFHVFRPKPGLDVEFLHFFLRRNPIFREGSKCMTGSSGHRRVPAWFFENLSIPLPPLGEQKRIARILSFSASLIEKSKQAVALLNPNLVFSESLVANAESTVPLSTYVTGITSGKSLVADNEGESQNKVLKISAVTTGTFLASEVKTLPKDYDPDDSHRVVAGDILVSRANTTELVGASVLVDVVGPNIFLPDKLWKLTLAKDVNPVFLWALLQSKTIRSRISRCSTGSSGSMKNISKKNFLSVHVPDISIGLQNKIGNSIQIIREQKKSELRRLSYLQGLHSSLMSVAFEGGL